jgi:hypothetical protein
MTVGAYAGYVVGKHGGGVIWPRSVRERPLAGCSTAACSGPSGRSGPRH